MLVTYDPAARATYVRIHDGEVAETVDVGDLTMVDLDEHGMPVGVEFLQTPADVTPEMVEAVVEWFPVLKVLRDPQRWVEPGMPRRLLAL